MTNPLKIQRELLGLAVEVIFVNPHSIEGAIIRSMEIKEGMQNLITVSIIDLSVGGVPVWKLQRVFITILLDDNTVGIDEQKLAPPGNMSKILEMAEGIFRFHLGRHTEPKYFTYDR